jgi:hypothetical protein
MVNFERNPLRAISAKIFRGCVDSEYKEVLQTSVTNNKQVKQILDRPLGFQEVEVPSGKFVSPKHRPPLLRKYSWYSFLLESESIPGP